MILVFLPVFATVSPPIFNLQQQITGIVTDAEGLPLPGVNILIKGRGEGTFSDMNGAWAIRTSKGDTLVFSYIGFKTIEEAVGEQTAINIALMENVTSLEGVELNAGYYTVKERERTGNIAKVSAEEIELQPVVNPLQALQGRMAGVSIVQSSSVPGSAATIQIRGQNSLRPEGNLPLYVVDGVPINSSAITSGGILALGGIDPLNTINLSNIESIEVLKDADATSIYGSRGANGVVLITTKKGKSGKTTLNINMYSGAGKMSNTLKMLNTGQYLEMRGEAYTNDGVMPTETNAPDLLLWDQHRYTDWQEELLGGSAFITDIQASVSGGNANTSFTLGGAYHKEGVIFPGDFGYQKITGNFNLNHTSSNEKFRVNFSTNYGVDKNKLFNRSLFVRDVIVLPPNAPALYNERGELNWEGSTWVNPLGYLRKTLDVKSNNIVTNMVLRYRLFPGLELKTNLGYTNLYGEQVTKNPKSSNDPDIQTTNTSQQLNTKRRSWIVEPQLVFSQKIGGGHLETVIGGTFQKSSSGRLLISGEGYPDESMIGNLSAAENQSVLLQEDIDYAYTAVFGRIGYNFRKKYFINLTGRRDGSSRFGPNKRFANFGAIGGAWIFSKEPFVVNHLSFLSFGKLRGSYGTTGSDQIADYGYYDAYEPTVAGGLYPTQLANPDYSWEVNRKLEGAVELGFARDRILFSASWYRNRSSNQLIGYALPAMTGFTSIQANLPATVQNTGWELELMTHNIQSSGFNWKTSLNITYPKNRLVEFPGIEQSSYANTYHVGASLRSAILYQSVGVNPETGLYEVLDANEDGRFDFNDRTVIKDLGRQYFGGINNSISYKNIGLEFFVEFVKQQGRNQLSMFGTPGRLMENRPLEVMERWQQEGDMAGIQRFSQSATGNTAYTRAASSDLAIGDASFIRLKTLSLSYQIPPAYITRAGLNACKVYIHAQNLFTMTNYPGLDPQYPGNIQGMPALRTITGGVRLTF
ncbi:SusC/RagA family TonB-linked outer membrane protein [Sinomicrobium pectinilyticum]|uniref:SusC/RagA family TonB-linked outer membrane protein n=2 Tax=Sinomicrobium pectinilyticum TaxID=1084421 RepID=A0A3N0EKX8_SINP1|nr:SusC/RagA family TonB-linked outer membrane protein [Sinomicrobium pectinilyticum]